jgi:hypothetical protein
MKKTVETNRGYDPAKAGRVDFNSSFFVAINDVDNEYPAVCSGGSLVRYVQKAEMMDCR